MTGVNATSHTSLSRKQTSRLFLPIQDPAEKIEILNG